MTIADLIAKLQTLPSDMKVKDSWGNDLCLSTDEKILIIEDKETYLGSASPETRKTWRDV